MLHKMKLQEDPFERIKNGTKTVEFRLYDEKRRTIQIGDEIEFSKLPELQENQEVKFIKIDVDQNTELAIKYNVMSIPTMIIFKNGNTSKTFIGVTDKSEIIAEF